MLRTVKPETDLLFFGNASINSVCLDDGASIDYAGGAAPTAAAAAWCARGLVASVVSALGRDYPVNDFDGKVDFGASATVAVNSNHFRIADDGDKYELVSGEYLSLPAHHPIPRTRHLHLSCRGGVETSAALQRCQFGTLSMDVMEPSVPRLIDDIRVCMAKADILFCNESELGLLQDLSAPLRFDLMIVCTSAEIVEVRWIGQRLRVSCEHLDKAQVVGTVGAGDSFLGGFLGTMVAQGTLVDCICSGLANATVVIQGNGPLDLLSSESAVRNLSQDLLRRRVVPMRPVLMSRFEALQVELPT